jgi:hypothetical protein
MYRFNSFSFVPPSVEKHVLYKLLRVILVWSPNKIKMRKEQPSVIWASFTCTFLTRIHCMQSFVLYHTVNTSYNNLKMLGI